jgi:hypothetical protein
MVASSIRFMAISRIGTNKDNITSHEALAQRYC